MRSSVYARSRAAARVSKAGRPSNPIASVISIALAALLVAGSFPAFALAAQPSLLPVPEGGEGATGVASSAEGGEEGFSHCPSDTVPSADAGGAAISSEDESDTRTDDPSAMRPAEGVVSYEAPLEPVASRESVRTFFLARALESTKTVPMVSAELSFEEEPVVGSFEQDGMTFAMEPGGRSAALVAVDYSKLPEEFREKQVLVVPSAVLEDMVAYSVTRIADGALSSLIKETSDPNYAGARELFSDKALLAEVGLSSKDVASYLSDEECMVDIDGDDEVDTVANPLRGCPGILALGIPASVTTIEAGAFAGSDTLQYLVVAEDNSEYASYDGALYDKELTTLRSVPEGRAGTVRVAANAMNIESEALARCPMVDAVVFDESGVVYVREVDQSCKENGVEDSVGPELSVRELPAIEGYVEEGLVSIYGVTRDTQGEAASESSFDKVTSSLLQARTITGSIYIDGNGGTLHVAIPTGGNFAGDYPTWSHEWMTGWSIFNEAASIHYYTTGGDTSYVTASRTGYSFVNWGDTSGTLSGNWNLSIAANWRANAYKVYFDPGEADKKGTLELTRYMDGYISSIVPPERFGYTFKGYYTGANGTGQQWFDAAGNSVLGACGYASDVSLQAYWTSNTYSITYRLSGGTIVGNPTSYVSGSPSFTLAPATMEHYHFTGWWIDGALGFDVLNNGARDATVQQGTYGNLTATAKWTPVAYSVTYDEGGGSFSGKTGSYTIETTDFTLPTNGARTGYTFAGWDVTGASGSGITGNGTTNVTVKKGTYGNLTATAKWTLNTYHLSWNVSHGAHSNRTDDFTVEDCPISMGEATPYDGYSFAGWSGEGLVGNPSSFTLDSSFLEGKGNDTVLSFTADFSPNPYTVRLHANDGTSTVVEHAVVYDAAVPSPSVPKRYGYAFSGYYVKEDDGSKGELCFDDDGTYVKDSGIWKGLSDVNLYACWTLMGDLEVPVTSPSTVSFVVDRATGQASAPDGSSSTHGLIRSSMPEEVPVASLALEALKGGDGTSLSEKLLGEGNPEECAIEVVFSPGASASRMALLKLASPAGSSEDETVWEFSAADRPIVPSATSVASGTTGDDIVTDGLGNLARAGELSLSYALKTLAGFDVYKVPLADASEDVARIVFTVDLTGVAQERF